MFLELILAQSKHSISSNYFKLYYIQEMISYICLCDVHVKHTHTYPRYSKRLLENILT